MLHQFGPYELIVPKVKYAIVAFADKNRNHCYDKDEAASQYVGAAHVIAPAGGVFLDLDIVISGPDEKVNVQSINLRGAGIDHTLGPLKKGADYFDCYLAGADFAT